MRRSIAMLTTVSISLNGAHQALAAEGGEGYDPTKFPGVLATAQGVNLTEGDVRAHVALFEFLVMAEASDKDEKALQADAVKRFQGAPALMRKDLDELHVTMKSLSALSDPGDVMTARTRLLAAFHAARAAIPQAERPVLIDRLFERVGVAATDAEKGTLLTDADADGFISWLQRMAALSGGKKLGAKEKRQLRAEMVKGFATLSAEEQLLLASGALLDTYWGAVIAKLTPEQKRQILDQAKGQAAASQPAAPAPQGGKGIDPSVYKIMSDMSLQSHATSMNIIEGIGGSGNYWEVVDSPW